VAVNAQQQDPNERLDCGGKIAGWEKLKALVLDSVSSPITKCVYNMTVNEFLAPLHQGDRERMEGIAGRTPARLVVDHHPHVGHSQTGRGSHQ
jgi:hypothetical protein